ncbi:VOC family protein [Streptomyces poonensis]|uniref:VOC family protein n=1 Tax=Streptomyces poonensis TaxID=68255 RepID=A0A918PAV9_9ACTN|nr:VOC family protein [Streptomyces poonensis]GGY96183.1 VOC family protein [Streptomyces poonensis]GLJ88918.1 VOC family protein [Streptomyces poonensis]
MAFATTAHLNFRGNAREALEFYRSVFGGRLTAVTYGDFGMPKELPDADKIVFGRIDNADNGFRVMAYDIPGQAGAEAGPAGTTRRENGMTLTHEPFFMSLRGETVEEVGELWKKLSEGATVVEDFGPAQWAPAFGMLTDRFGVTWVLDVAAAHDAG